MKRSLLGLALLGTALAVATGGDALACGDKLVVVGRGLHAKGVKAPQRASILLFAEPKSAVAAVSQQYRCVVRSPGEQKDYIAVINEALAERAKQAAADQVK